MSYEHLDFGEKLLRSGAEVKGEITGRIIAKFSHFDEAQGFCDAANHVRKHRLWRGIPDDPSKLSKEGRPRGLFDSPGPTDCTDVEVKALLVNMFEADTKAGAGFTNDWREAYLRLQMAVGYEGSTTVHDADDGLPVGWALTKSVTG